MRYGQLAALAAIVLLGAVGMARALATSNPFIPSVPAASAIHFPGRIGNYVLVRTWDEGPPTSQLVYVWAEYAPPGGGTPIGIGISPVPDWHDPVLCHSIRGEDPVWHGQLEITTGGSVVIGFSSALYNSGVTQYLEASTLCRDGNCGEFTTQRDHFGFIYTHPEPRALLGEDGQQAIRVLLRVESLNTAMPAEAARLQLTDDLRTFLVATKLGDLTRPYSH